MSIALTMNYSACLDNIPVCSLEEGTWRARPAYDRDALNRRLRERREAVHFVIAGRLNSRLLKQDCVSSVVAL